MEAKPLILIVDDDKNTREGLGRALQGTYEVLLADGGARALDLLAAHPVEQGGSGVGFPAALEAWRAQMREAADARA